MAVGRRLDDRVSDASRDHRAAGRDRRQAHPAAARAGAELRAGPKGNRRRARWRGSPYLEDGVAHPLAEHVGEIDARRCQGQGLAAPAAGVVQDGAQWARRALGLDRSGHEGAALVGGEVEALAPGVVQLHGGDRCSDVRNGRKPKPPGPGRQPLDPRPGAAAGLLHYRQFHSAPCSFTAPGASAPACRAS
jgi:hypothetical protein